MCISRDAVFIIEIIYSQTLNTFALEYNRSCSTSAILRVLFGKGIFYHQVTWGSLVFVPYALSVPFATEGPLSFSIFNEAKSGKDTSWTGLRKSFSLAYWLTYSTGTAHGSEESPSVVSAVLIIPENKQAFSSGILCSDTPHYAFREVVLLHLSLDRSFVAPSFTWQLSNFWQVH